MVKILKTPITINEFINAERITIVCDSSGINSAKSKTIHEYRVGVPKVLLKNGTAFPVEFKTTIHDVVKPWGTYYRGSASDVLPMINTSIKLSQLKPQPSYAQNMVVRLYEKPVSKVNAKPKTLKGNKTTVPYTTADIKDAKTVTLTVNLTSEANTLDKFTRMSSNSWKLTVFGTEKYIMRGVTNKDVVDEMNWVQDMINKGVKAKSLKIQIQ